MRLYLLFLVGTGYLSAAIAVVNSATGSTSIGTTTPTSAFSATTGNLLDVSIRGTVSDCTASRPTSVTDTAGNTYTFINQILWYTGGQVCNWKYYAKNITGNASNIVTVNWPASTGFGFIAVTQYSGCDQTAPLDTSATGTASSSTSVTSGTFTTSTANQVINAAASDGASSGYVVGLIGGVTATLRANAAGGIQTEDLIVSSIQTGITAAMSAGSDEWGMLVATYKAAANTKVAHRVVSQ